MADLIFWIFVGTVMVLTDLVMLLLGIIVLIGSD